MDPSIVQSIEIGQYVTRTQYLMYKYLYILIIYVLILVLLADVSDLTKVIQLANDRVLDEACHEVMLTLQKVFCSPFYHSKEVRSCTLLCY